MGLLCLRVLNTNFDTIDFSLFAQGARIYSLNYYSFVKLAKAAKANIQITEYQIGIEPAGVGRKILMSAGFFILVNA